MYAYAYTYPGRIGLDPLFGDFSSFVASDGGAIASPANATAVIDGLRRVGLLDSASLVCTCDSGKVDKLYYMVLSPGAVLLTEFKAFVSGDSGTQASEGYTATVIQNLDRNDLLGASLICTCDSGKASTLYYMIP
jgi:hypothetical protein